MAQSNRVDITDSVPRPDGAIETPPADPAAPAAPASERPSGLPEKFKTVEELVASYSELEKKLGSDGSPPEAAKATEGDANTEGATTEGAPQIPDAPAAPTETDSFLVKFENEYAEKGALTDDSYAELEAKGLSRAHVDAYIAGREAQTAAEATRIYEAVGGKERWEEMMPWASQNMPAERIEQLNDMIARGGETAIIAAQALQASYAESNGLEPNSLTADGISLGDNSVFESTAQIRDAMADPRYKKDAAYQQKVAAKLARSNNIL